MPKKSAGILACRIKNNLLEVLLVHPGGPFWKNKDVGVWSIPKGEYLEGEEPKTAAIREFKEELGIEIDKKSDFIQLNTIKQKGGKEVIAFAVESDADITNITSNTILINWPPKSIKQITIPEVDKAGWFNVIDAWEKVLSAQGKLISDLLRKVFRRTDDEIEKLKHIARAIKESRLVRFFYISKDHADWRIVEPYMIAIHNVNDKRKDQIFFTGIFLPDEEQKKEKWKIEQRQYFFNDIDLNQFEILDKTFSEVQVPLKHIHETPTITVLFKTALNKFTGN